MSVVGLEATHRASTKRPGQTVLTTEIIAKTKMETMKGPSRYDRLCQWLVIA